MSTRIKGKSLSFTIADTDYKCDLSTAYLQNEDEDGGTTTFCNAADGGPKQWYFDTTGIQSTDADSYWTFLWTNAGQDVDFVFSVHGNAVPSATQPHFTGTVHVGAKPPIGGDAGNGDFTFDYRLDLVGEPTMLTAPAGG